MRPSFTRPTFMEHLETRLLYARLLGIDVSKWDATVNWGVVKTVGLKDFAYIKATQGLSIVDSQWANNVNTTTGAIAKGLYAGFYHFAEYDEGTAANAEADWFFDHVKTYLASNPGKVLQPVLDVERPLPAGWSTAQMVQWVDDWCFRVRARAQAELGLSVTPLIYASRSRAGDSSFYTNTIDQNWPLWVAAWPTPTIPNPQTATPGGSGYWADWAFWQYAADPAAPNEKGTCPGIGDGTQAWPVDLNVLNGDINQLQDYIIGSVGRWADGTWVQVNSSGGLNAWNDSSSNSASPHNDTATLVPNGTLGKVLQGPVYANGYQRWQIQYSNGVTGWSAEPFLNTVTPAAPTNPTPASATTVISSIPNAFTWTASNASSYDVYLDGVFQGNVTTNSWTHGAIATGTHTWRVDPKNSELSATGTTWTFNYQTNSLAWLTGNTLNVAFDGTAMPITLTKVGFSYSVQRDTTTLNFAQGTVASFNVIGTSAVDNLQFGASLTPPLTFNTVAGNDTLSINAGAYTFASDLGAAGRNLAVTVAAGASATFGVTQHLRGLIVAGNLALTAGAGVAVQTSQIIVTGKLNLNDGAIAYDYGFGNGTGLWNGSAYSGISGMIASGRNGGLWDGASGLITTMTAAAGATALATIGVAEASSVLGLTSGQTASWMGLTVDNTTGLARYTYAGDANVDGKINGDDYFAIDGGFSGQFTGFAKGDFDYSGKINADDYFLIDRNYNKAAAALSASLAAAPTAGVFSALAIASAYAELADPKDLLAL